MKNFDRGKRGGRRFGGDNSQRHSIHKAVCSECGNNCEVPFKPTGSKPIFCDDCFRGKRGAMSNSFGRKDFNEKKMYSAVCSKCGSSCELPFRPKEGKPVYCDECFGKGGNSSKKDTGNLNEQFGILSDKLDKILNLLDPDVAKSALKKKVVKKKDEISKTKRSTKKTAKKAVPKKKIVKKKAVSKKAVVNKARKKKG